MQDKVNKVLKQAKILLKKQRYDDAHDFNHHKRVWNIAKKLIEHVDEPVNRDVLKIACMWHDVITKNYTLKSKKHKHITTETAKYLKKCMLQLGFSLEEVQRAYLAVKHHEFTDKPNNVEGKILYDADKLDAFTPKRVRWFTASKQGKESLWGIKIHALNISIVRAFVRRKFHFKYSKKIFDKKIKELQSHESRKN